MNSPSIEYSDADRNRSYEGVLFEMDFTGDYLKGRVRSRYMDEEGTESLIEEFADINQTEFDADDLRDVFQAEPATQNWRIGECLAECFLEDHRKAVFPHNRIGDLRNHDATSYGPDLVGFTKIDGNASFLFGEVKTSSDAKSPPSVMSVMNDQLEKIKRCDRIQKMLIHWLGEKIKSLNPTDPVQKDFVDALCNYFKPNKRTIMISGVLIRDTDPNRSDLKPSYERVGIELGELHLALTAIYLPVRIDELKTHMGVT